MYYTMTPKTLAFILEGTEQIAALRAKIKIEKSDITDVTWHSIFSDWSTIMVRMPGSYLPRWIMAGSYWTDNGWDFVYAKKPRGMMQPILHNVMVLTTKKDKYKRIIIETTKENMQEIKAWWQENSAKTE